MFNIEAPNRDCVDYACITIIFLKIMKQVVILFFWHGLFSHVLSYACKNDVNKRENNILSAQTPKTTASNST